MAIPATVCDFLVDKGIDYHVIPHPYTDRSVALASVAAVPFERLAKGVVLVLGDADNRTYALAVLPASRVIDMHLLRDFLGVEVHLAEERTLTRLLPDCAPGAVPALGAPYHLETLVDTALPRDYDLWFEAGDHRELIEISAAQFDRLTADARRGHFTRDRTQDDFRH